MSNYVVEPLPVTKVWLGEGPHWDAKSGKLFYVDILRKSVHSYDPVTFKEAKMVIQDKGEGEDSVSLIVPVANDSGKFIISLGRSLRVLEWDGTTSGSASDLRSLETVNDGNPNGRFNDGKCDSNGRLWAGTMGYYKAGDLLGTFENKRGRLYKLEVDGTVTDQWKDIDLSNGLAWSPDNKTMYFIDSLALSVDAFDFNLSSGTMTNRRVVFDLKENGVHGFPDGMCIDENGNLWVAIFSGAKVININPNTGKLIRTVGLPTANITSVAFGGPNLDVLYVTCAQNDLTPEQLQAQPTAGLTFKITNLGVRGLAAGVAYAGTV